MILERRGDFLTWGCWGGFYVKITVNQAQRKAIGKAGWKRAYSTAQQWTHL